MPIFGITASSNMSAKLTDFYQIATTTVGSGGAADITFSNIPATYTHLQIRGIGRSTFADTDVNVYFQFNADTATNYSDHAIYGTGASAASYGNANNNIPAMFRITGGNSTANRFGVGVADILDYRDTNKFKTTRSLSGHDQNGSGLVFLFSSNWRNTNAITSVKLFPAAGNFAQYSSFQLYGVVA